MALCDLDGFKEVNDRDGHRTGDALLVHMGRQLSLMAASGGAAARLGGDEFRGADVGGGSDIDLAERIEARVSEPFTAEGVTFSLSTSVGLAKVSPYTISAGRSPRVKVEVDGTSRDHLWFAYDTVNYPSGLIVSAWP